MDLISVHAAMETDEQRLRPFKTTSGNDFTAVGVPILNTEGFKNPNAPDSNYIDTNWIPSINGIKFTQDNAFVALYGDSFLSEPTPKFNIGVFDDSFTETIYIKISTPISTSLSNSSTVNDDSDGSSYTSTKTGLISGEKRFFASATRINSTTVKSYINGIKSLDTTYSSVGLPNCSLFILGLNFGGSGALCDTNNKTRALILGSKLINSDNVSSRLNTFFVARGLTTFNY